MKLRERVKRLEAALASDTAVFGLLAVDDEGAVKGVWYYGRDGHTPRWLANAPDMSAWVFLITTPESEGEGLDTDTMPLFPAGQMDPAMLELLQGYSTPGQALHIVDGRAVPPAELVPDSLDVWNGGVQAGLE